ncbi:sporulation protein YqfD [Pseudogracilibacillus sp. ICA-222130]|uniref:sporulation protein YqfD n=1 Tax=Pseudogracilibacillus sp. ICA-222130 TaxID=3134655 RepID=UPI0030C0FB01
MKFHKVIFGAYHLHIHNKHIERFLKKCYEMNVPFYQLCILEKENWSIKILRKDWHKIAHLMEEASIPVTIVGQTGITYYVKRFLYKKEWVVTLVLSSVFLLLLQFVVLDVRYNSMPKYIEKEIEKEIKNIGLQKWAWIPSLDHPKQMEQHIIDQLHSIQHIQIERSGNTYWIDVEEKKVEPEEQHKPPQHLVAKKSGVIEKAFIVQGDMLVNRYEVVEKGDILVSGEIMSDEDEDIKHYVHAEGAVYATTWYEMNISMPVEQYKEQIVGINAHQYRLRVNNWEIPIWGNVFHSYASKKEEMMLKNKWKFLPNWPVEINELYFYKKEPIENSVSKDQLKKRMTHYITKYLKKNLGKHVKIKKYYVLHEEQVNGKVKWNLYVSVTENIASPKKIHHKR